MQPGRYWRGKYIRVQEPGDRRRYKPPFAVGDMALLSDERGLYPARVVSVRQSAHWRDWWYELVEPDGTQHAQAGHMLTRP